MFPRFLESHPVSSYSIELEQNSFVKLQPPITYKFIENDHLCLKFMLLFIRRFSAIALIFHDFTPFYFCQCDKKMYRRVNNSLSLEEFLLSLYRLFVFREQQNNFV